MHRHYAYKLAGILSLALVLFLAAPSTQAASIAQVQAQVDTEYHAGNMNGEMYNDLTLALKDVKYQASNIEHPYDVEAFKIIVSANAGGAIQADAASRILSATNGL